MAERTEELANYYDEAYFLYAIGSGEEPYQRGNPVWESFFGRVADNIIAELQPRTVFDAGCGIGFLVEALRDRGVEAWGVDISEYAIGQVREDIRPYCKVGSVTDELERDYDLIVSIEVLEHLPPHLGEQAIEIFTRHTDNVLFSSTPDDFREPSHVNVQPTDYWVGLFARHGFYRDPNFDASFVAPHAILFKRLREAPISVIRDYERWYWRTATEIRELRAANTAAVEERARFERERARLEQEREEERARAEEARARATQAETHVTELRTHYAQLEKHASGLEKHAAQLENEFHTFRSRAEIAEQRLAEWEAYRAKSGWRIYVALAALRLRLAPLGTRRDRVVRSVFGALAALFEWVYRLLSPSRDEGTPDPAQLLPLETAAAVPGTRPVDIVRAAPRTPTLDEQYQIWLEEHALDEEGATRIRHQAAALSYRPLFSVVMPVYNTDPSWLRSAIESVRGQLYEEWELCIADDCSTREETQAVLREYEAEDGRVKVERLAENGGISAASNAALRLASGDFVALLDHDDELKPDALFEVAKLLNEQPALDYVYSDEDKRDFDGSLVSAFFKPDWSPDLLLSGNYVTHFSVFRREVVERVGGFRSAYDGSQDYDLVLRVTEATDKIGHVAKPLYTWRKVSGSTAGATDAKPFAYEAAKAALADALERRGIEGFVLSGISPGYYRVKYAVDGAPKVAIVICVRGRPEAVRRCVESVEQRSGFSNYELVLVHDDRGDRETLDYLSSLPARVVGCSGGSNSSTMMNAGARAADCDAILFLGCENEVVSGEWIEAMLEHGRRREVGAVGARFIRTDGRVQHEGVVVGARGAAAEVDTRDYFRLGRCVRDVSAVAGACMLTRPDVFAEVGGFDERFPLAFADVDYCLKLRERGYLVVYTPYALLFRHDGGDGLAQPPAEDARLCAERWRLAEYADPYYNPNLSLDDPFTIRIDGARARA